MRKPVRVLIWLSASYLAVCVAIALFLVDISLHPVRRGIPAEAQNEIRQLTTQLTSQLEDVQISAADGVPLRGWFIRPLRDNGNAVILLHGLGDNRLGMTGYAEMLLHSGYAVLLPDARAHGISGGNLATYGVLERYDIKDWFEWLSARRHPHCIFGLGESMGAAQLLQSIEVEPSFCAVVAESSFSNFREIAYDRMGQYFHAGPWVGRTVLRPAVEIALAITRVKYQVDLTTASPENAVSHAHVPVLLIHGVIDSNIPVRHSRRIKQRAPELDLWEVPGADHCGAMSAAPDEFEQRTLNWFSSHQPHDTKLSSAINK